MPSLEGTTCDRVLSGDGVDPYFCALEFAFCSELARVKYDGFVQEFAGCFGADAAIPVGPAVNHPDSYDQTVFDVGRRQVSVALKDKGALQKTYVCELGRIEFHRELMIYACASLISF